MLDFAYLKRENQNWSQAVVVMRQLVEDAGGHVTKTTDESLFCKLPDSVDVDTFLALGFLVVTGGQDNERKQDTGE